MKVSQCVSTEYLETHCLITKSWSLLIMVIYKVKIKIQ